MGQLRKPFQGVANILRFNWHFYAIGVVVVMALVLVTIFLIPKEFKTLFSIATLLAILNISASLIVSWYVYDYSELYELSWLDRLKLPKKAKVVNINAGFDETSSLIKNKLKVSELKVLDFYDPNKHTEISIKRARKAYPPYPNTMRIQTDSIPLGTSSIDAALTVLSAHEIRDSEERSLFFKEVSRILKPGGNSIVVEHQRDMPNMLAFGMGAFHFFSPKEWLKTFNSAGLEIKETFRITPFITAYILEKNGNTP